jgi:hypothetical protein
VDTSHEATTLTIEIGVDFLLKGGLVEVSTSDGNTEGNGLLESLTSYILEDSNGRVDSSSFTEESSDSSS